MSRKNHLISLFFKALFAGRDVVIGGVRFKLRKIDGLRRFDVGDLLFIEQNPQKNTPWAKMAQRGKKIMWVIDTKFNRYLARVEDGKIIPLKKPSSGEK